MRQPGNYGSIGLEGGLKGRKHQRGYTLVEALVAGTISIVAVGAMLIAMANTVGSAGQTIRLTRLSQELRSTMQILSRELRRANYHGEFLACYGDFECLEAGTNPKTGLPRLDIADKVAEININNTGDCVWFWYDRPQAVGDTPVPIEDESVAGFRLVEDGGGIGRIQLVTDPDKADAPNCNADVDDADWTDITDADFVDVTAFTISDADSFTEELSAGGDAQLVEQLQLTINARLLQNERVPAWMQGATTQRTLTNYVTVRNNVSLAGP